MEPIADRIIRFYAVYEAEFTVEGDRDINRPDFSDVGYEAYPVGKAPDGYVLQPEIRVYGDVTFVMPTLARDSSFIIFKDVASYGSRFSYCIEKLSSMFKLSY